MKLTPRQRGALLVLALLATLALTFGWEPPRPGETGVAEAAVPKGREPKAAVAAGAPDIDLARLTRERAQGDGDGGALFGPHSWAPPPPPPEKRAGPPPKPKAPPLPFTYMGKMIEGGAVTVFLAQGENSYIVKAGDTIEDRYRVESINDGLLTLTYLPLKERQQLAIGGGE